MTNPTTDTYNGYTNRETWAVKLYIDNDQEWQEIIHSNLRERVEPKVDQFRADFPDLPVNNYPNAVAGEIIRENVEARLDASDWLTDAEDMAFYMRELAPVAQDIGSLYRVNWDELGAAFLADLDER